MARNFFARLFRRNDDPKQMTTASQPSMSAAAPAATVPPAVPAVAPSIATPVAVGTASVMPVVANDVTERQCVSCGRDLTAAQAVCPSCGLAVQAVPSL